MPLPTLSDEGHLKPPSSTESRSDSPAGSQSPGCRIPAACGALGISLGKSLISFAHGNTHLSQPSNGNWAEEGWLNRWGRPFGGLKSSLKWSDYDYDYMLRDKSGYTLASLPRAVFSQGESGSMQRQGIQQLREKRFSSNSFVAAPSSWWDLSSPTKGSNSRAHSSERAKP